MLPQMRRGMFPRSGYGDWWESYVTAPLAWAAESWSQSGKDKKAWEAARIQVALARSGKPLSDYRKAEDVAFFWKAPTDARAAYYKGAYWMAVVSRLTRNKALGDAAASFLSAHPVMPQPTDAGKARAVYAQAVAIVQSKITAAERANPQVKAVLAIMGHQEAGGITTQVKSQKDREFQPCMDDTAKQYMDLFLAALVPGHTIECPTTTTQKIWGVRIGAGALLVLVAGGILRPYMMAAGRVGKGRHERKRARRERPPEGSGRRRPRRERPGQEGERPRYNRKRRRKNTKALTLRAKTPEDGKITAGEDADE